MRVWRRLQELERAAPPAPGLRQVARLLLQIHDELLLEARTGEAWVCAWSSAHSDERISFWSHSSGPFLHTFSGASAPLSAGDDPWFT